MDMPNSQSLLYYKHKRERENSERYYTETDRQRRGDRQTDKQRQKQRQSDRQRHTEREKAGDGTDQSIEQAD